jgi:hypothetical protein
MLHCNEEMSNFTRHALNVIMADDSANHDDPRTSTKAIPKERLKELLKTALEKLLSIYAYSSELTKEEVEDIYSGDENRIYREAYERLEIFNWPIERHNAYERSKSDRLSMEDKFEQCYEDGCNEGFKNGYNEGRKACFRPFISLVEVLWKVLQIVLLVFLEVPKNIFKRICDGAFRKALRRFSRIFNGRKSRYSSTGDNEDSRGTFVEHQKETLKRDKNKDTDGGYQTGGNRKKLKRARVSEIAKGKGVKDIKGNFGKSQNGATNEQLLQQTFTESADNLLSIHQTTNNTQEATSTMKESHWEMTKMLEQMEPKITSTMEESHREMTRMLEQMVSKVNSTMEESHRGMIRMFKQMEPKLN